MLKVALFICLIFIGFNSSARTQNLKQGVLLSFTELQKLSPKKRSRYMKAIARSFIFIEQKKKLRTSSLPTSIYNLLILKAYADEFRCIAGGVPRLGGATDPCGVNSYAGFTCPAGKEICNPYLFGVQPNGSPLCFRNATTQTCFNNSAPGSTTSLEPVFAKDHASRDYEKFRSDVESICSTGTATVHESTSSLQQACQLIQRQSDTNRNRNLPGYLPPDASSMASEDTGELGGGTEAPTPSYTPSAAVNTGLIPSSYFEGGAPDAQQVFNELYTKFAQNPEVQQSQKAVQRALAFFAKNRNGIPASCGGTRPNTPISNQDFIIVTDFTRPYNSRRMLVLNLKTGAVISTAAAHGYGSNVGCPSEMSFTCTNSRGQTRTRCSVPGDVRDSRYSEHSGRTERGFFLTGEQGRSSQPNFTNGSPPSTSGNNYMVLDGLNDYNYYTREREVIFHRASYVRRDEVSCANSAGCPSIAPEVYERIKDQVDGGALMYNHTLVDDRLEQPEC